MQSPAVPVPAKNRKSRKLDFFFSRLNPANWFNEFRDITINMEEYGPVAGKFPNDVPIPVADTKKINAQTAGAFARTK